MLNQVLKVSAFGTGSAGAYAIRQLRYQWRAAAAPVTLNDTHVNQSLLQVDYVTDLRLVYSLLHCAPDLVIDWI